MFRKFSYLWVAKDHLELLNDTKISDDIVWLIEWAEATFVKGAKSSCDRIWDKICFGCYQQNWEQGKNYMGSGRFYPRNAKKEPSKIKRAPENCHRLQCKSLLNVADLVIGMCKVAPEKKKKNWAWLRLRVVKRFKNFNFLMVSWQFMKEWALF